MVIQATKRFLAVSGATAKLSSAQLFQDLENSPLLIS